MFGSSFLYEFLTLYAVLDPVAAIPIFLAATAGLPRRQQSKVALIALSVSFLIFLFFIVCGDLMLEALHIPMASFQMAGALILLLFGLQMTLGKVTEAALAMPANASLSQRAIFPLAMPCIAGAGSIMTVMLLTDNHDRSFSEQLQTTGVLLTCLMLQFVVFALAVHLHRLLGRSGIEILTRVFGLILTSIAVNNLVIAIKHSFNLL
jgi:multiple antibiotic resistance protein